MKFEVEYTIYQETSSKNENSSNECRSSIVSVVLIVNEMILH